MRTYDYDGSYITAAKDFVRDLALGGIRFLTSIYDPYQPKFANLGPNSVLRSDCVSYDRIEEVFDGNVPIRLSNGNVIRVVSITNERIIYSPYKFYYQPFEEPRLHELRAKYKLDEIVRRADDEFEAMVRLREWARSQFRRSDYQPVMSNFDALTVLDRNLRDANAEELHGAIYDPCHFFPLLYIQILLSVGYQSRLVTIGHGMAEVWSNQYRKWVVMDAEFNLHYEKDGIPLNLAELFEENYAPKPSRVQVIRGCQTSDRNTIMVAKGIEHLPVERMIIASHVHIDLLDLRNDWMTNHYFPGHPMRSEYNSVVYSDPRLAQSVSYAQRLRPRTHRKEDLYWTLNQTELLAHKRVVNDTIALAFRTVTPNFEAFDIVVDGGTVFRSSSPTYSWKLHEGENSLSVTAVNKFGRLGIASSIRLILEASVPSV